MTHANCSHLPTRADRAACRRKAKATMIPLDLTPARKAKVVDLFHSKVTVYTEETRQKYGNNRVITVWDEAGNRLGTVTEWTGSIDRQAGNLRVPGKMRTLWAPSAEGETSTAYWAHCTSISAAIRMLLR